MRSTIFHFSSYSQYHFYQSNSEVSLTFLSCMILSKKKKKRNIQGNGKLPNHLITSSTSSLLKNANGLNFVSKKTFAAKLIGGSFSDYIKKPIYLRWNHFLNNKRRPLFLVGSVQINFTTFKSDAVHVIFLCFES